MNFLDFACSFPSDKNIQDMVAKASLYYDKHERILIAVSGGADSDRLVEIFARLDAEQHKCHFVFFNTGLEYRATLRHLDYLEEKYGIEIIRYRNNNSIINTTRKKGVPFWSKKISSNINRLQLHGFQWEDEPLDVLIKRYCKKVISEDEYSSLSEDGKKQFFYCDGKYYRGCVQSLRWWCNDFPSIKGKKSKFNIEYTPFLKEFMLKNPPDFLISDICCTENKKNLSAEYVKAHDVDLIVTGVKKCEGGVRADAYQSCFSSPTTKHKATYRPLWWLSQKQCDTLDDFCNISHSDCYLIYGLVRTGCVGCPFGKDFEFELQLIQKHEPELYPAVLSAFGKAYDYTRKYIIFREMTSSKTCKSCKNRNRAFDCPVLKYDADNHCFEECPEYEESDEE